MALYSRIETSQAKIVPYDSLDLSDLEERFHPPKHLSLGIFKRRGRSLRYAHMVPSGAKATIIIIPGHQEPLEKYFEFIRDMDAWEKRWAVFIYDPYDQGGSGRYVRAPEKVHSLGFEDDIMDLETFLDEIVFDPRRASRPSVLIGHSKGAHLAMRYLAKEPDMRVSSAAFVNPMLSVAKTKNWYHKLLKLPVDLGLAEVGIPNVNRGMVPLTHDPVRGAVRDQWAQIGAYQRTNGSTFGWLYHALHSMEQLNQPDTLFKLNYIPIFVSAVGNDKVVRNDPIRKALPRLDRAEFCYIEGALHDIWMEINAYRNEFLTGLFSFLDRELS